MTRPFLPADDASRDGGIPVAAVTRREIRENENRASRRARQRPRAAVRTRPAVTARPALALTLVGLFAGVATGAAGSPGVVSELARAVTAAPEVPEAAATSSARAADAASRGSDRKPVAELVPPAEMPAPPAVDAVPAEVPVDVDAALVVAPAPPEGVSESDFLAGILTPDASVRGTGSFHVVPGEVPAPGAGEIKTVRIQVEEGLEIDAEKFATFVMATLNDPRSWGGDGSQTFARTAGDATFTVSLASPDAVDRLCAPLDTEGLWSCGTYQHAVLNSMRWAEGSGIYGADTASYRQYLVNHEVGHVLGHKHVSCGGRTTVADVMVQQSGDALACAPNGWPFP